MSRGFCSSTFIVVVLTLMIVEISSSECDSFAQTTISVEVRRHIFDLQSSSIYSGISGVDCVYQCLQHGSDVYYAIYLPIERSCACHRDLIYHNPVDERDVSVHAVKLQSTGKILCNRIYYEIIMHAHFFFINFVI